eukprot:365720-Chlamydomonas_euryale.AAC.25
MARARRKPGLTCRIHAKTAKDTQSCCNMSCTFHLANKNGNDAEVGGNNCSAMSETAAGYGADRKGADGIC